MFSKISYNITRKVSILVKKYQIIGNLIPKQSGTPIQRESKKDLKKGPSQEREPFEIFQDVFQEVAFEILWRSFGNRESNQTFINTVVGKFSIFNTQIFSFV